MNFDCIIEHPKTVDEAVDRLLSILTDKEIDELKSTAEDELIMLHFTLGRDIRNAFGLNSGNTELLGSRCADDVSMEIIERLYKN